MAKRSMLEREKKRKKLVDSHMQKRLELRKTSLDMKLTPEERFSASVEAIGRSSTKKTEKAPCGRPRSDGQERVEPARLPLPPPRAVRCSVKKATLSMNRR